MIDTHCHLNFHSFKKNYAEKAKSAFDSGVTKIINVGAKLDSSRRAVKIANEISFCFAAVGIHPHHAQEFLNLEKLEKEFSTLLDEDKKTTKRIVAIGECGLDYHIYAEDKPIPAKNVQTSLLELQIQIANKYGLPLIFHCREAYSDLIQFLQTAKHKLSSKPGVIHCFQGSIDELKQFLDLGFYIGFDGYITYAKNYEDLVFNTPIDKILTETDSPWLTPVPFRGTLNEPKNIKIIADAISKIKKISLSETAKITQNNAEKLFSLS